MNKSYLLDKHDGGFEVRSYFFGVLSWSRTLAASENWLSILLGLSSKRSMPEQCLAKRCSSPNPFELSENVEDLLGGLGALSGDSVGGVIINWKCGTGVLVILAFTLWTKVVNGILI